MGLSFLSGRYLSLCTTSAIQSKDYKFRDEQHLIKKKLKNNNLNDMYGLKRMYGWRVGIKMKGRRWAAKKV